MMSMRRYLTVWNLLTDDFAAKLNGNWPEKRDHQHWTGCTRQAQLSSPWSFFMDMLMSAHVCCLASSDGVLLWSKRASRMASSCLVVLLRRLMSAAVSLYLVAIVMVLVCVKRREERCSLWSSSNTMDLPSCLRLKSDRTNKNSEK